MNSILPIILCMYIILFILRYFIIQNLNKKKLLPNTLKENSITFIKLKNLQKSDKAQFLCKRYNLITALLWGLTLIVIVIVISDNIRLL
jgi:hypothetical protein